MYCVSRAAIFLIVGFASLMATLVSSADVVDLSSSVIVFSDEESKAAEFLSDEIHSRTSLRLPLASNAPKDKGAIVLSSMENKNAAALTPPSGVMLPTQAEGYAIWFAHSTGSPPAVHLVGRDKRGVLFAAGRFLRLLEMRPNRLEINGSIRLATAPRYPIRGHQLGYRNTANAYDAWDIATFEQYIRDLIVFGANGIELIPPVDSEERDSPHMDMSMWDMTVALSALLDSYDLDVWFWLPVGDGDVSEPEVSERNLAFRRNLFEACQRVDDVFVPGGDPGDTPPAILMPWLEKLADVLHDSHPDAGLWVSNQGFTPEQNDIFFDYLEKEKPDWLAGVVFGPWTKISLDEQRRRTPAKYPIRRYPDITHTVRCQYPVPGWDRAFARTLGREPFNPRPEDIKVIHGRFAPLAIGSSTYSDGINDDVNKALWSALEWDPDVSTSQILDDYGRYFIGEDYGDAVAQGLFAFESNWHGPAANQTGIERNLTRWQGIEKAIGKDRFDKNWRLQLCVLRAYYDAYVQRRLLRELQLEQSAYEALTGAEDLGVDNAVDKARSLLDMADMQPEEELLLRQRLVALGQSLFDTIGMQLDVENYQARNAERGAVLEFLDEPLNNCAWLKTELDSIAAMDSEEGQLARIASVVNWEHPGEGSYYDDLGNASKQPHLLSDMPWQDDPGRVHSTQEEFSKYEGARLSWADQAQTLFGTPLRMRYTDLDSDARYTLRITYAGRFRATMSLIADSQYTIHDDLAQPSPIQQVEFDVPHDATSDGTLDLEWQLIDGRGCQVAEVWLLRHQGTN